MTGRRDAYRITSAPGPARQGGAWRGVLAVIALFVTAADALATALIGIPPVGWLCGQVAAVIRSTYRRAAYRPPPAPAPVLITGRIVPPIEKEHTSG
jgi:hypothetical protein